MEDKKPDEMPVLAQKNKNQSGKPKKIFLALLVVALLALLVWLWFACNKKEDDLKRQNSDLKQQVQDLRKQLHDDKKKSAADAEADDADTCPDASDELKANIQDAVTSKNYAALQDFMTDPTTVVYAATEFGGPKTPAQAVAALDYLNNGTAPWDFNLPAATIAGYADGDYSQYFPEGAYVGRASDDMVVSFDFECGKINQIFISVQEEIL